ncbi:choline/ethanolamine kinase isoform X2 [Leptinotarsa decemlineata]|uniref:choline/ethanolamine kinase isoform X2 n=1 Tax=Leptinotarsa decemlineata TaxID=7539 RepID=UPI000C251A90|nr:choline/ethanolamine kinase isoform X2 [Leptinotarsa decemlineata]
MLETVLPKKATGDCVEMRELTARICRDYLHGAWKRVNSKNIGFKHISGGLSNLLYHVSLPDNLLTDPKTQDEPKEVLIRVYGQTHGEGAIESLITESVIFTLLSERGLGPKLHGIFPGGRIEEYINARPLLNRELADQRLSVLIAQKMASIHSMEVPLHKEPDWLWNTLGRWLKTCIAIPTSNIPECARVLFEKTDFKAERNWLKHRLEAEDCPVYFCHNDLQEGNILLSRDADLDNNNEQPELVIIDFEYCSYNYRSFDIANHFAEWVYDYTEPNHPFYKEDWSKYPSEKQRMEFIRAYLDESGSRENPKKVLREVEVFSLASHFFWAIWAFINAETSNIPFGYWEYACARLNTYYKLKQKLSGSMQLKRKMDELTV